MADFPKIRAVTTLPFLKYGRRPQCPCRSPKTSPTVEATMYGRLLGRLNGLWLCDRLHRRMRRDWPLLHSLHHSRMARPLDLLLCWRAIELGMNEVAAQLVFFFLFDHHGM